MARLPLLKRSGVGVSKSRVSFDGKTLCFDHEVPRGRRDRTEQVKERVWWETSGIKVVSGSSIEARTQLGFSKKKENECG
jgi:hypothetical protein